MNVLAQLRQKGLKVQPSSKPGELWICCPFCVLRGKTPDAEYKLGFNYRTGLAHCFRCSWSSRERTFEKLGLSSDERLVVEATEPEPEAFASPVLPEDFELLAKATGHWAREAIRYLLGRRVVQGQIVRHRVGISLVGKTKGRIVFPFLDPGGRLVGWSARSWFPDVEPKWLHSTGLKQSFWAHRPGDSVVLVEGIFDALAVERVVDKKSWAVMALLGTNLTEEKRKELGRYDRVVVWLDPDKAGQKGVERIVESLYGTIELSIVPESTKRTDPGDMTDAELQTAFGSRTTWNAMSRMLGAFDGNT